jgi:hypothetical protein
MILLAYVILIGSLTIVLNAYLTIVEGPGMILAD